MVRLASMILTYSQTDLMISQFPKILYLDLPRQRSLLPPVQGATANSQTLHSDQALQIKMILRSKMIVPHSETDIPKMHRELKEKERNVTRNWAQPRSDEASRTTVIFGPMSDNREIQAMTTTSVRIIRMEIGSMTGIERVRVSIERREGSRATGATMLMLTQVMHRDVLDLQEGVMRPLGIERKVATKTVGLKSQKMGSPGIGGTKRGEVLAGQSVTGIEVGKQSWTLSGWTNLSRRSRSRSGLKRILSAGKSV